MAASSLSPSAICTDVAGQPRRCPLARALAAERNDSPVADNDREDDGGAPHTPVSMFAEADADRPVFTKVERLVVDIGRRDPLTRIAHGSPLAKWRQRSFGIEAALPFADRRLEALRSLALALRRRGRSPEAEIALALQAGITPRQIDHLRSAE